ncbi:MAG: phosphatase PAP2 family protein [archaeon]|nr:phosphatase PAP2 family protein [archaeon]
MTEKDNSNKIEIIFYSMSKTKFIKSLLLAFILWIFALIFYIIPDFEHQILVSMNDIRGSEIFSNFWFSFSGIAYYLVWILLLFYILSFLIKQIKSYRMPLLVSLIIYAIGSLCVDLIKIIVARERPWIIFSDIITIYEPSSLSFPSGHAFMGFLTVLPLITALIKKDKNYEPSIMKYIFGMILFIYACMMAASRIILGVHFPSDVLFSIGLAIIFHAIVSYTLFLLIKKEKLNARNEIYMACIVIIALIIVYLMH